MIKKFNLDNLKNLYNSHIVIDFPPEERPSYTRLAAMINDGLLEVLSFYQDNKECAYSICAKNSDHVLVLFFAVFTEHRNHGIGTKFLNELKKYYSNKSGLIVEVEKPELAENSVQKEIAIKRISFYSKSDFTLLDNIEYIIWDVPMYLMVYPSANFNTVSNAVKTIYKPILGKNFDSKLIFKEINH